MTLLDRLRKAEEPSRELDAEIAAHVGFDLWSPESWAEAKASIGPKDPRYPPVMDKCPHYTASLDAAMTLVPDHMDWRVGSFTRGKTANAVVTSPELAAWNWDTGADAATPALALCIAAIQSRTGG